MLAQRTGSKRLPRGMDAAWDAAQGYIRRLASGRSFYLRQAQKVVDLDKKFAQMTDAALRERALSFRDLFRCGRDREENTIEAFALVREVAVRTMGEKPYMVQVAGAMAINAGCIAEMATGEGKTLTATMPATIAGWRGKGAHIVTTNDYLAKRDAEWMQPIYKFCGLSVDYIEEDSKPQQRRQSYLADITYLTNKTVTADFLRDRLALGRLGGLPSAILARLVDGVGSGVDRVVQRGLNFAIVDEADSVLIDEAVVPLILSGEAPNPEQVEAFQQAKTLADGLTPAVDYTCSEKYREIELTGQGRSQLEILSRDMGGLWQAARRREELVVSALTAREFYHNDKHYVLQDGKAIIVDEFTGRLMPDREWRDGLHQAVQAKELLEVQPPKTTYARISFQRFFRLYRRLAGMTGTASEAWAEFWQIYHTPVVIIPTNRPCRREVLPDAVYTSEQAKWQTVVEEVSAIHSTGRPVLLGTRSVRASETLSQLLTKHGLENQVLNAVRLAEEAEIVARAGLEGRITVATNMAGRGTDIKLGRGVADRGGLFVLATERHESARVDRQLFGRCARQGDPGTARAMVCLQDELICRNAGSFARSLAGRYGQTSGNIAGKLTHLAFGLAQRRAQRTAWRMRRNVLQTDDWLDEYLSFAGAER